MFSADRKNGEAVQAIDPDLDRRPATSSGHTILRLDGTPLNWRMGERLPFTFANGKTLNLRPASFVVMGMLTKIARAHYDGIVGYDAELNKIKSAVNAQKIQAALQELGEIDQKGGNEAVKKERRTQAVTKMIAGGDIAADADAEKRMRELTYLSNDLNKEGMFQATQYIFLDATDEKELLRWKDDRRPPTENELNAALPREKYEYDFLEIEIKDLLNVYYQLNFLPTVEKKGYLNLMIP